MSTLLLISETFTNGYRPGALDFIFILSIISAIFVIIAKNPIVSVLFLIGLFLGIACYLLVLGINFIGLSYLLVYVGAVSILFLFILMLINVRISELLNDTSNTIPLALIIALLFIYPLYQVLPHNVSTFSLYNIGIYNTLMYYTYNNTIGDYLNYGFFTDVDKVLFVSSKMWDGTLAEATHISSIGNIMYTNYSIWLIITSVILLLAMVGAIIITIKQR